MHEEITDALIYCIMPSDKLGFDLDEIIFDKLKKDTKNTRLSFLAAIAPKDKRPWTFLSSNPCTPYLRTNTCTANSYHDTN